MRKLLLTTFALLAVAASSIHAAVVECDGNHENEKRAIEYLRPEAIK